MKQAEQLIVKQLKAGNDQAYKYLYEHHYQVLCHMAHQYVADPFLAETIVGDVIFHLWEVRASLQIDISLRSYLMRSVRNRCLDYLQSQYKQREILMSRWLSDTQADLVCTWSDSHPLGNLLEKELEEEVRKAIDRLPTECRQVFRLSRFAGKRQEEIARELGISINTVKYHIKRALSLLSSDLSKYLISTCLVWLL